MQRRQLIALVICTAALNASGNMALTLLPVYAVKLGMDEGSIGIYLGLAFAALAVGALSAGWFSDRFQQRKRSIIVLSLIALPATYLMGQVSSLFLLVICTMVDWFAAGLMTATFSILAGLYARPDERGRIFGFLAVAMSLGIALSGFAAGFIVDHWGYAALFLASALLWLVVTGAALLIQDDLKTTRPTDGQPQPTSSRLSVTIWLLLIANTLSSAANFGILFVRPLIMNAMNFEASAITNPTSFSSLVTLPLPFLVGWLSDRIGRRQLVIASYIWGSVATLVLIVSRDLWLFWLTALLFSISGGVAGVANAFVTDLTDAESLSRALSYFSATQWIGGVLGYTVTGLIIRPLGMTITLLIIAALPVLATVLLANIRSRGKIAPIAVVPE